MPVATKDKICTLRTFSAPGVRKNAENPKMATNKGIIRLLRSSLYMLTSSMRTGLETQSLKPKAQSPKPSLSSPP